VFESNHAKLFTSRLLISIKEKMSKLRVFPVTFFLFMQAR